MRGLYGFQRRSSGLLAPARPLGVYAGLALSACSGTAGEAGSSELDFESPPVASAPAPVASSTPVPAPPPTEITLPNATDSCADQTIEPLVRHPLTPPIFRSILYSWTTEEQAGELRAQRQLFTRTERPGLGPGYAYELLVSGSQDATPEGQLAKRLTELFERARYAWHNPWATRLGWPGESYGDQPIRIELKPDAWLAYFDGTRLHVETARGGLVPLEEALANPERIGVIYFIKGREVGGPYCGGSFAGGGEGYREFIVGNQAMVESWSMGTEAIRKRLSDDVGALSRLLERVRACPGLLDGFNAQVTCDAFIAGRIESLRDAYEASLAIPSSLYEPTPSNLATLIDTLAEDVPELDPLIVFPNE